MTWIRLCLSCLFLQLASPKGNFTGSRVLNCLLGNNPFYDSNRCGYVQSHSWLAVAPWLASIRAINSPTGELVTICAGVLINQRYVVTPAECLLKERLPARVVQLGIS
uniref:Uncharacterized protein n=2 Tax=Photinus pyralis TaxID=7054 RepID=A0A1Y1K975_PHOPY